MKKMVVVLKNLSKLDESFINGNPIIELYNIWKWWNGGFCKVLNKTVDKISESLEFRLKNLKRGNCPWILNWMLHLIFKSGIHTPGILVKAAL